MNFDPERLALRVQSLVMRTGNMPEDMRKETIHEAFEEDWDIMMGKVPGYLAGANLIRDRKDAAPGFFNLMSLGNWITIAEHAGVRCVPARLVGLLNPVFAFRCSVNGIGEALERASEADSKAFIDLVNNVNGMKPSEILRFDPSASAKLKLTIQDNGLPDKECRGLHFNGKFFEPEFSDPRLAENFVWFTDAVMPVWKRSWVKAMRIAAAPSAIMPNLPACATRAVEWRLYVRDGAITAASQYYPHAPCTREEALDTYGLAGALDAGKRILDHLATLKITPHHPRYELRDDLDPNAVHCTLDFLITPEGAPLLLEAGPAHLRNPNWGAHPCNFGTTLAPAGIALGNETRCAF